MEVNYNGLNIESEIIGGFKIEDKEYVVTSYADDASNCKIVILQLIRDENGVKAVNVPDEDIEKVTAVFNEVKETIMEEEDE